MCDFQSFLTVCVPMSMYKKGANGCCVLCGEDMVTLLHTDSCDTRQNKNIHNSSNDANDNNDNISNHNRPIDDNNNDKR